MKFSIVRSKFLDGLQRIQNVVSGKGTLQILQNAMIQAEDNRLCMTTTDLDISERCYVECEIEEAGSTTLPIRRLTSIIRELDEGKIMIEVNEDDVATVQSGSSYFKIIGMSVRDFPPVPATEGKFCYRVDQGVLREMLRKTSYAISQDETRRVLNGVLMAFKDNKLTMVATDGRRLALVEHEIEFPPEAEAELILPNKAVSELMRLLGNEGDLKVYAQKNQAVFEIGTTMVSSKLIDGVYPNYRQVIPGACDERVVIEREALLSALRRVSVVTTDKSNAMRLTFSANQLTISINTPDVGEGRDTVPVKYAGKEISIIFNPEYVMDPLKNIDDDEVFLEMNDGHSPALLKCNVPFLYVLMPLRIS
ncbi:MAG: DNA polymerase III subunit beta [Kiritimatiellia bacterium]|jgi:DNA polymerase-3 subunit beta|nr:DNA polymerase III subunit beta [Kiritimatiellia bacterium]MDD4172766.1 DNA polymerase III subunit beta [Kiritimatiellia bacterium]MDD4440925.1 DNA polymerase III subunit beta [Kiritimatiellia bacterium]MDX9792213.1 DNA polymerase III subunit beta [Kiritimatiellia bacterium]NLC80243.1 DNA polymerase III subunit beta [Lentisphaerota bacterium]